MKRRTILKSKDARRLLRHMAEDPPNPLAKASLERGRKHLQRQASKENLVTLDANSFLVSSLKQELESLRSLAFVPSSESSRPNQTWKERASELTVRLDQLQPNAEKNIQIEWLSDEHDCETCGASCIGWHKSTGYNYISRMQ